MQPNTTIAIIAAIILVILILTFCKTVIVVSLIAGAAAYLLYNYFRDPAAKLVDQFINLFRR